MLENEFRTFLEKGNLTGNGVAFRMSKARKAESILRANLDAVVSEDNAMYDALTKLSAMENPAHNPMQNAVRKYYIFKNGKEFPQLRYYRR